MITLKTLYYLAISTEAQNTIIVYTTSRMEAYLPPPIGVTSSARTSPPGAGDDFSNSNVGVYNVFSFHANFFNNVKMVRICAVYGCLSTGHDKNRHFYKFPKEETRGIPVVSKNRKERFEALVQYLQKSEHNIVCLQEIWSEKDYVYFKEGLRENLPYSHYFYSGVVGSGLCVFSKWLIQDVFFHQWPLNGYIHKIHHGDWFGGKGVGLCRIKCGVCWINVYCTHLHAEYHDDDMYLAHRVLQAHSTAELVKLTAPCADICLLAGDLNTGPGELSFKLITEVPSLIDPFDMQCECTNPLVTKPSGTCDNINNSYSDPRLTKKAPDGKRIDHILFRVYGSWETKLLNFGNPLSKCVPGQPFSYSDHNAVTLELQLHRVEKPKMQTLYGEENCKETIDEAIKVCEEATGNISKTKTLYLTVGGLLVMFLLGTVGFWPTNLLYDIVKLMISGLCFYCLVMGSLWSRIELNSLKAGLTALYLRKSSKSNSGLG